MTHHSDVNTGKVFLVGSLGVILTTAVTLVAIVAYFAVEKRVEQSRSDEAAVRTRLRVESIVAGNPVAQPWLNPDQQRATQEAQLARYAVRETTAEDGTKQTSYAIPIQQAMETVLKEAGSPKSAKPQPKEAGP